MNQQEFEERRKRFQQDIDMAKTLASNAIGYIGMIPGVNEETKAAIRAIAKLESFIDRLKFPGLAPEHAKDAREGFTVPKYAPLVEVDRWVEPVEVTFEELAEEQGVKPMSDTSKIIGIFPDMDIETGCKG